MGQFGDTAGETNWWEKYDFDQDAEESKQQEERNEAEISNKDAQEEAEEEEEEEEEELEEVEEESRKDDPDYSLSSHQTFTIFFRTTISRLYR